MSDKSYWEGYEDGLAWIKEAKEKEAMVVVMDLGFNPPHRSGDDDYNRGVQDGMDAGR